MSNADTNTLLFAAYGGGHATMLAPVILALRAAMPDLRIEVLSLTMARNVYEQHGIHYREVREFVGEGDEAALAHGERLAEEHHSPHTTIPREESVAYLGLSYMDLVQRHGEKEAANVYEEKGRMAFYPLSLAERVLDEIQPDMVVVTNSPRMEAALLETAYSRGIETLAVTDLLGTFIRPLRTKHLSIASTAAEAIYRASEETQAEHYPLLGNPAMDRLLEWQAQPTEALRRDYLPEALHDKKLILLDMQKSYYLGDGQFGYWTDAQHRETLTFFHTVCRAQDAVLMLRPHPSLAPEPFADWADEHADVMMAHDIALEPLLRCVDLACSGHSTMLIDALYCQTPALVYLAEQGGVDLLGLSEKGCAHRISLGDEGGFADILQRLGDESSHQAKFAALFPALPSAPRFVKLIEECLNKR